MSDSIAVLCSVGKTTTEDNPWRCGPPNLTFTEQNLVVSKFPDNPELEVTTHGHSNTECDFSDTLYSTQSKITTVVPSAKSEGTVIPALDVPSIRAQILAMIAKSSLIIGKYALLPKEQMRYGGVWFSSELVFIGSKYPKYAQFIY